MGKWFNTWVCWGLLRGPRRKQKISSMEAADIKVAVDPASKDGDRCCKIHFTSDADGIITIHRVEDWKPEVLRFEK